MARWPWNRNKSTIDVQVPPEVEEYYQSTQKDRRGMAWLLALATLILTILVAIALFFGGRWVYRAITGDDSDAGSSQVDQEVNSNSDSLNDSTNDSIDGQTSSDQDSSSSSDNGAGDDSSSDDQTTADDIPSENNSPQTPTQTPVTGPSESAIPRTGPAE